MKYIKTILSLLFLGIPILFSGDLFQMYSFSFADFYNTSINQRDGIESDNFINELKDTAKKYDIDLFMIDSNIKGDYETTIEVYSSRSIRKYLEKEYSIQEGNYKSFLLGETRIQYHDFVSIPDEVLQSNPEGYYMFGTVDNMYLFKGDLVDKYGGFLPRKSGANSRNDSQNNALFLWIISITLVLLFTYYGIVVTKKELFIRISLGESVAKICAKNIMTDLIFMIGGGSVFSQFAKVFFGQLYLSTLHMKMLILLVVINSLLHCTILRFNIKTSMSNQKLPTKLLVINYLIKASLSLLLCLSLSANIFVIMTYYDLSKQKEYYEEFKDYEYINLIDPNYKDGEQTYDYETMFYIRYLKEFGIIANKADFEGFSAENIINLNYNRKDYLLSTIPSFQNELESGIDSYILIPKGSNLDKDEMDYFKMTILQYSNDENGRVKFVYYPENIRFITWNTSSEIEYNRVENPVILYSNCPSIDKGSDNINMICGICLNKCPAKVDHEEVKRFCEEHNCRYLSVNVYEDFMSYMKFYSRAFTLAIILLGIQFVMEAILMLTIIRLEFEANRLELVIKKILGYSLLERMKKLYVITFLTYVVSIGAVVLLGALNYPIHVGYSILALVGLLIIESLAIAWMFRREERHQICRVLKGG